VKKDSSWLSPAQRLARNDDLLTVRGKRYGAARSSSDDGGSNAPHDDLVHSG